MKKATRSMKTVRKAPRQERVRHYAPVSPAQARQAVEQPALDAAPFDPQLVPDGLLCEAAAAGLYSQELLVEITKQDWQRAASVGHITKERLAEITHQRWQVCTDALQRGFDEFLVHSLEDGRVVLSEMGQVVLEEARKARKPMQNYAIRTLAEKLTKQHEQERQKQLEAASGVLAVNDALGRILGGG